MKVLIVGSGAIGGLVGARLALAGHEVMFLDKPEVIAALEARGLTLINRDGSVKRLEDLTLLTADDEVSDVDLIVLAVKAHDVVDVASLVGRFTKKAVPVLTVQNGIPWWYFQRHGGQLEGRSLTSLDPDGRIANEIDPDFVIGCIAYPAAESVDLTTVRHVEGSGMPVGELDGKNTARIERIAKAMQSAGFKSPVLPDVRSEIWLKAWGALSFNPVSALTGATMRQICRNSMSRRLVATMMREAQQVAERLDIQFRVTLERRIDGAERVGDHKTSMLQDREAGRKLEVEALLGAVCEIGELLNVRTPTIESVYGLTKLLNSCIVSGKSSIEKPAHNHAK